MIDLQVRCLQVDLFWHASGPLRSTPHLSILARHRTVSSMKEKRAYPVYLTIRTAMAFIFGLSARFGVAAVAFIALSVARSTSHPVFSAWVNRGIEPRIRATVLSTIGQMDAIGQVAGGLLWTPSLALYGRALGQDGADSSTKDDV